MEKIVSEPLKVDFHIHSEYSRTKDENDLVKNGTISNLPILISKLNENGINMACITDHDYFSYKMYCAFKSYEGTGCLKKVLPGIEFSVGIPNDKNEIKQVHVIAIFDDSNQEKLKKIEDEVLKLENGKVKYNYTDKKLFSESGMIEIFRKIGLNVVLIAHQKNSYDSKKVREPDLKIIGERKFNEFLTSEVFESLEFRTMRNGLFNNLFADRTNKAYKYDVVKFITGSDCHQWDVYPAHDSSEVDDNDDYQPTYLKCLPTFKGVTMSLSDYSRITLGNNLFSVDNCKLHDIKFIIKGNIVDVPLSDGINAIIGDNSIGKSLLLHKLTNFDKLGKEVKDGYISYLNNNGVEIEGSIENKNLYYFDSQGNIRERFQNNTETKNQEFLNVKFPEAPDKTLYVMEINKQFDRLYELLKNKFDYDDEYEKLKTLLMIDKDIKEKMISVAKLVFNKTKMTNYDKIKKYVDSIIGAIKDPSKYVDFESDDINKINNFTDELKEMSKKYKEKYDVEDYIYNIKTGINQGVSDYNDEAKLFKNQDIKVKEQFDSDCILVGTIISKLIALKEKISKFSFDLDKEISVVPSTSNYNGFTFVKRFKNVKKLDNDYLNEILKYCLKKNKVLDSLTVTKKEFVEDILKNYDDNSIEPIEFLKSKVQEKITEDFKVEQAIIKSNQNVYDKLSNGLNSTLYFDIIAGDEKEGIYIIDQPEDDVSQNAIKSNLISDFRKMSSKRQIILVTHNPQFVVNLDVDNVICIHKDDNGELKISSGALEYEDKDTNIIKLVADNLDGGVDSIRKRWKRYGKELRTN